MSSPSDRTPPSPTLPAPPPDPMPDNTGDYVGDTNAMMPNPMPTREAVQHEELPAPGAERPGATNPAALPMQKGPAIDLDDDPLAPAAQQQHGQQPQIGSAATSSGANASGEQDSGTAASSGTRGRVPFNIAISSPPQRRGACRTRSTSARRPPPFEPVQAQPTQATTQAATTTTTSTGVTAPQQQQR